MFFNVFQLFAESYNLGADESYYSIRQNETNYMNTNDFSEALQSELEKYMSSTSSESERIQNPPGNLLIQEINVRYT